MTLKRLAILDDYLHLALESADWSALQARCQIDVIDRKLLVPDEAAEVLRPYNILCHLRERLPMPRALLEQLPNLEFMTVTGLKHRTLDLACALERGVKVSHVSAGDPGSRATPEMAWGLILATARHIALEDRRVRQGVWQSTTGMLLDGRTLGLLGLGRVGQIMAGIGRAFGMNVIAWSPNLTASAAAAYGVTRVDKEDLFRQADVLSVHVVLSERSHHMVGAPELALMKPRAVLVNTSRGAIVDEAALVAALQAGRIGGAGLDVFEHEPLPADHPLCALDNVVLTPHLGYATSETFERFYRATVKGVTDYLDGRPSNLAG